MYNSSKQNIIRMMILIFELQFNILGSKRLCKESSGCANQWKYNRDHRQQSKHSIHHDPLRYSPNFGSSTSKSYSCGKEPEKTVHV